jgi:hypothetical protein
LSYAKRCAGYLMVHGMPKPGDRDATNEPSTT